MKSNLSLVMFPLFLLAAACSEDKAPAPEGQQQEETVEIVFSAGTGASGSEADAPDDAVPDTRTIYTHTGTGLQAAWNGSDNFPVDYDRVGIVVTKVGSNTLIEGSNNIPYKVMQSGKRSPLEAEGSPLSGLVRGETYRFMSYYPYDAAQSFTDSNYPLYYFFNTNDQRDQTQAAPNDLSHLPRLTLMCADPVTIQIPDDGSVPVVDFNYRHCVSTLQMRISNKRDEPITVKEIRVKGDWWFMAVRTQISTLYTSGVSAVQTLTVAAPVALDKGAGAQSFWLVIPGQGVTFSPVTFMVDTDKGEYTITKTLPEGGLKLGRNYTLDIAIPQTPGEGETWTPAAT